MYLIQNTTLQIRTILAHDMVQFAVPSGNFVFIELHVVSLQLFQLLPPATTGRRNEEMIRLHTMPHIYL